MEKKPELKNYKLVNEAKGVTRILEIKGKTFLKVKRIYFINNVPKSEIRGNHAHHKTEQILIVLKGNFKFGYFFKGKKMILELNENNNKMIFIPNYCWHWMENFSKDCILCVAASTLYDKKDYILNYQSLLEIRN